MTAPAIERYLSKIKISQTNFYNGTACWEWTGGTHRQGYGLIKIHYLMMRTHRFIYEYYYGQICPDLQINHKCKNTCCGNPLHLEQVTAQQNVDYSRQEYLKGLQKRIHHNSKKTHCKRGHEFTSENTYNYPNRHKRMCKTCHW